MYVPVINFSFVLHTQGECKIINGTCIKTTGKKCFDPCYNVQTHKLMWKFTQETVFHFPVDTYETTS